MTSAFGPDATDDRLVLGGICPICFGGISDALTLGVQDAALVLLVAAVVVVGSIARVGWKIWRAEAGSE